MSTIKVIEYISSLNDGGAETLVKDYARLIDKKKFEIAVVVTRHHENMANTRILQEQQIPIIPIYPQWNFLMRVWNKLFGRRYIPYRLKKILQEEKAEVVHVHLDNLKNLQAISRSLHGIRLFYTCHNLPKLFLCGARAEEGEAAKYLLEHNDLRMIALHDDMKNELNEMFAVNNTVVIRNGIDFNRFRSCTVTCEQEREALGIPDGAFVIGHVGRFTEQKNHPFLVDVFREVATRNENAYLLMVGAGDILPIEAKLVEYGLAERYMILSHRTDVHEIMQAMDVFAFPSTFEGLGIVLIEAQVCGLRCVVSDAVPTEAIKTLEVVSLPLGDAGRWADVILDESIKGTVCGNLDDYDMNKEIKRLEKLYLGELDE